jgi:hypothetical protein
VGEQQLQKDTAAAVNDRRSDAKGMTDCDEGAPEGRCCSLQKCSTGLA